MKKLLLINIVIITVIAGCTKYKEGPKISFRSVYSKIIGTWQLTEYICDGVDSIQYYNDICGANLVIGKYDDYHRKFIVSSTNGKKNISGSLIISFNNKYLSFISFPIDSSKSFTDPFMPNQYSDWFILRLTKKEFIVTIKTYKVIKSKTIYRNYKMSFKKL